MKLVIFDLDGTIANTLPLCIFAFKRAIEPLIDRPLSDEEIISTFGPSEEGTIMALAPDYYEQGVSEYLRIYKENHEMCPKPFNGILDVLNELKQKQIPIAIVTGKGEESAIFSLKYFKILDFFDAIETGSPKGSRKREGLLNVINKFAEPVSYDKIVYIGDVPSDIIISKSVGIPVIAAAWAETAEPKKLIEQEPDLIFYEVEEFKKWILNI